MTARQTMEATGKPGRRTMRRFIARGERTGSRDRKSLPPASHGSSGPEPPSQEYKLSRLLESAARLMAVRGYDQTTIRDVSRETGFSLAGLYYYFKNKEDLLFQIQRRTFESLLDQQARIAAGPGDAGERLRLLLENHVSFFTRNANEMKVCAFELQSLKGEAYEEIAELRRRYYRIMAQVVGELMGEDAVRLDTDGRVRHWTLFIFGMLNWTFMWFDEARDGPVERLGREMADLVLPGLGSGPTVGDRPGGGDDRDAR